MLRPLINAISDRVTRNVILIFLLMGSVMGTWVAYIPFLKNKHQLDEAQLGLLLLCMPLGAIAMNPIAVGLMHRLGEVKMTLAFHAIAATGFWVAFLMPNPFLAGPALFFAGMIYSAVNVAINTCSSAIEQHTGRFIMSSCHGFWSLGAMLGSLMAATAIGAGIDAVAQFGMLSLLLMIMTFVARRPLSQINNFGGHSDNEQPKLKWPNKLLWTFIIIGLCVSLLEGAMVDWSTIYMREVVGSSAAVASVGFSAYALFMASGRFFGDFMTERFGSMYMVKVCGVVSIIGMLTIINALDTTIAIIGFAIIGAGVSLAAPILYAASAKVPGYGKGVGLATMNSFAMFGFLGGPAIIGFIAKLTSLSTSFMFVCGMCFLWLMMSFKTKNDFTK